MADYTLHNSIGLSQSNEKIKFPKEGNWLADCYLGDSKDEGMGDSLSSLDEKFFHITQKYIYLTIYFERPHGSMATPPKTSLYLSFFDGNTEKEVVIVEDFNLGLENADENQVYLNQGINVRYVTKDLGHTYSVVHYRIPSALFSDCQELTKVRGVIKSVTTTVDNTLKLSECEVKQQIYFNSGDLSHVNKYDFSQIFVQRTLNPSKRKTEVKLESGHKDGTVNEKYYGNNNIRINLREQAISYLGNSILPKKLCFYNETGSISYTKEDLTVLKDSSSGEYYINLKDNDDFGRMQITNVGFCFDNDSNNYIVATIENEDGFYHHSSFSNNGFKFKIDNNYCNNFISASQEKVLLCSRLKGQFLTDRNSPYIIKKRSGESKIIGDIYPTAKINQEDYKNQVYWNGSNGFDVDIEKKYTLKKDGEVLKPEIENSLPMGHYTIKCLATNLFTGMEDTISISTEELKIVATKDCVIMGGLTSKINYTDLNNKTFNVEGNILLPKEEIVFLPESKEYEAFSLVDYKRIGTSWETIIGAKYYLGQSFEDTPIWEDYGGWTFEDYSYAALRSNGVIRKSSEKAEESVESTQYVFLQPVFNLSSDIYKACAGYSHIYTYSYQYQLGRITDMKISSVKGEYGSNLLYYLIDNGGDRREGFGGNDFINTRLSTYNGGYFSLSRDSSKKVKGKSCSAEGIQLQLIDQTDATVATFYLYMTEDVIEKPIIFGVDNNKILVYKDMALQLFKEFNYVQLPLRDFGLQDLGGQTYVLKGKYYYYYGDNFDNPRELFNFETSPFTFLGGENVGIPVLGLRTKGVIINPTEKENLSLGESFKVNAQVSQKDGKIYCKPFNIALYQNGAPLKDDDDNPITCNIEYKADAEDKMSFYFDGVNVSKLKEQSDANKTSIGDTTNGLIKDVKDNTLAIGNNSNTINSQIIPHLQSITIKEYTEKLDGKGEDKDEDGKGDFNTDKGQGPGNLTTTFTVPEGSICIPQLLIEYIAGDKDNFAEKLKTTIYESSVSGTTCTVKYGIFYPKIDSTWSNHFRFYATIRLIAIKLPTFATATSASLMSETPMTTLLEDEDPYASVLSMPRPDEQTVLVEEPENTEVPNEPEDEEI